MKYDESTMPQEPDWVLKTDPKKGTWPTNGTLNLKMSKWRIGKVYHQLLEM